MAGPSCPGKRRCCHWPLPGISRNGIQASKTWMAGTKPGHDAWRGVGTNAIADHWLRQRTRRTDRDPPSWTDNMADYAFRLPPSAFALRATARQVALRATARQVALRATARQVALRATADKSAPPRPEWRRSALRRHHLPGRPGHKDACAGNYSPLHQTTYPRLRLRALR
jgi:hypothetical protein